MDDDKQNQNRREKTGLARALAAETGITLDQAQDLIAMIGTDRNSLLREARILRKRSGQSLS